MSELDDASWESADDALVALARAVGVVDAARDGHRDLCAELDAGPPTTDSLTRLANARGFDLEEVECTYAELPEMLATLGPSLVRLDGTARVVAIVRSSAGETLLLGPTLARVRISTRALLERMRGPLESVGDARVEHWLASAKTERRRAARARRELLLHLLGERRIGGVWLLRTDPGGDLLRELRRRGVVGRAVAFVAAAMGQVALGGAAWAVLGHASLEGRLGPGWLHAWVVFVAASLALQLAGGRLGQRLTQDVATLLKERLLRGALRMSPDEIRRRGSGHLLATVSESGAIESAGLSGALGAVIAAIQLASAAALLAFGAGGLLHAALLVAFTAGVVVLGVRAHRRRRAWTDGRLDLTNAFIEQVLGHRTRSAQQVPSRWHDDEDAAMVRYLGASRSMESSQALFAAVPSRGWMLLGFAGLLPALLAGPIDPRALALSIVGVLAAQGALGALAASGGSVFGAWVGWTSIGELFHAAARRPAVGLISDAPSARAPGEPILEARGVGFRHRTGGRPTLVDCSLTLRHGERVLLEGPSGGGKSTLAGVLTGLHAPEHGHVLLGGLDLATRGREGWRRRIASAPQFHENHVLSGTLAFNLLMGRSWPPTDADRAEAEAVCRELALGPLLDRMPGGLDQVVGETGWQLSHGEKSRLFFARALLQKADVVLLDETFGALDPLTLRQCIDALERRAPSAIVIAHP